MRQRHQAGSIQRRKHGKKRVWVGLYYDANGIRRYVTFADAKSESDARNRLAEILLPINRERSAQQITPQTSLAAYVEHAYIPFGKRKWKASTAGTTVQRLTQHVINGEMADVRVCDLSRESLQAFLDRRGLDSFSVVNHLRWDLRAICRMAVEDGLLTRDPATSLFTPPTTKTLPRLIMTRQNIIDAIAALDLRERVFCRFALYAGLRPGEIIGLRWPSVFDAVARIDKRFYKGIEDTPKGRRGKDTKREAALPPSLMLDLEAWRKFAITDDAYLFPTENGTPVKYENLMEDFIRPKLKPIGLGWVNFQVMRRTWSSMSKEAGVSPKVTADQLGHSVKVDLAEYTKSSMAQKRDAVKRFEEFLQ